MCIIETCIRSGRRWLESGRAWPHGAFCILHLGMKTTAFLYNTENSKMLYNTIQLNNETKPQALARVPENIHSEI